MNVRILGFPHNDFIQLDTREWEELRDTKLITIRYAELLEKLINTHLINNHKLNQITAENTEEEEEKQQKNTDRDNNAADFSLCSDYYGSNNITVRW